MDPTSPHVTPPPAPRRPPYLLIAVTVLAVALVAAGVTEVVRRARLPRPPAVDTTGLDPAVARAIGSARARVEKDLLSGKAWGSLGQVYMAHAYNSEADACLVRAAALDPGEARWPYLLFEVRRPTSPETGLPHLERSVELCGDVLSPRLVLGEVLFEGGQLERAEGQFRAVLGRNPPNPRAHFGLGRIALARGDLVAGTDHLTKAAAAAPGFKAVHASLAQVYHRRSMTQEEKHELELVAALPNAWVWPNPYLKEVTDRWVGLSAGISWARELEKRGQARDAVKVLESLRTDYPDSPRLWLVLGSMLNGLGDFPKAEQAAREAVRTDQNRAAAHFQLGYALKQQGKLGDAEASYRKAGELDPQLVEAEFNLGLNLVERGDLDGAVSAFRACVRARPTMAAAHRQLGLLLARQDHHAEALEHLAKAAELAPRDEAIRKSRRDALEAAGKASGP